MGETHSITPSSLVNSYNGNYAYFSLPNDANNDGAVDLILLLEMSSIFII